ncbi:HD domain-containing protein [Pontibacter sp. G13]|uniref:HD domain-containing protein n=1 Tax=Pontibacter sp. G13 TaxID=3074898 RepID=UPI00288AD0B9|nr:HD domain-containing protein [Pontibacter sp. G13]WNJ18349.1 HD domain-containing protein [Pontibacter sp. G13]
MNLPELPQSVSSLLDDRNAPIRLIRHLKLVHSTAHHLVDELNGKWPTLVWDSSAILFGAATHDIGKIEVQAELFEPGKRHEQEGYHLLLEAGFPASLARFAKTHGQWNAPGLELEDLAVVLADKLWKGKRGHEWEERFGQLLAQRMEADYWEIFSALDEILSKLAEGSDARIHWQGSEY